MRAVLYVLAGIFVGLGAAFALVVGVGLFSAVVYPLPKDFDGTMEAMCRHVQNYPQWVLAVVVPLWFLTGMAGTCRTKGVRPRYRRWEKIQSGDRLSHAEASLPDGIGLNPRPL
jgi:hypothetical protein